MHKCETNQKRKKISRQDRIRYKLKFSLKMATLVDSFLIKSLKGYLQLQYSALRTSLISHYSASLVFQNNRATSAGKTKTKNVDHSSIGQFYQHGLFFPQRLHNVHVTLQLISTTFETKSYLKCWLSFSSVSIVSKIFGVIFWVKIKMNIKMLTVQANLNQFCRKIHCQTGEFRVKLHAKTDIAKR